MNVERVLGWHPYKWFVLGETVIFGTLIMAFFDRLTGQTLRHFPQPYGYILVTGLVAGSAVSLYGMVLQRYGSPMEQVIRGLLWEQVGQIGFGLLLLVYAIWAIALLGGTAFWFSGMLLSRGGAAILTVIKIEVLRRKGVRQDGPS